MDAWLPAAGGGHSFIRLAGARWGISLSLPANDIHYGARWSDGSVCLGPILMLDEPSVLLHRCD